MPSIFTHRNNALVKLNDVMISRCNSNFYSGGPDGGGMDKTDNKRYTLAFIITEESGIIIRDYGYEMPPEITIDLLRQWGFVKDENSC